jgi:site-specific DNA-methyltransferase (adenine-specific)
MKPLTRTKYRIIQADVLKYLRDYQPVVQRGFMPKYHAIFADPPYFLGSIVKRFGKEGATQAVEGRDGAFRRLSKGFMGQTWDGFESPQEYQAWVTAWAEMLLDFVYPGAVLAMFGGTRTYHRLVSGLEDAGWEIFDSVASWVHVQGFPKNHSLGDGYGTALKPAVEPIVLARAPRQGFTYQHCFDKFGTSAFWIDGTRTEEGRYPANLMLGHHPECNGVCHTDCIVRDLDGQSGNRKSGSSLSGEEPSSAGGKNAFGRWNRVSFDSYADEGSAARMFFQSKPAAWERDAGMVKHENIHPTLKPITLTERIAKLIKPPVADARILIPFSGSGSEMIGAHLAGWKDITGIEMTGEYIPIAQERLAWWTRFENYAEAESHYKKQHPDQMTLFEAM